jgi:hypothetical protein
LDLMPDILQVHMIEFHISRGIFKLQQAKTAFHKTKVCMHVLYHEQANTAFHKTKADTESKAENVCGPCLMLLAWCIKHATRASGNLQRPAR